MDDYIGEHISQYLQWNSIGKIIVLIRETESKSKEEGKWGKLEIEMAQRAINNGGKEERDKCWYSLIVRRTNK